MRKLLIPLLAALALPNAVNAGKLCKITSELVPDATLRHLPKLDKVGASSSRYKLIYKGKQIKNFSFTQFCCIKTSRTRFYICFN